MRSGEGGLAEPSEGGRRGHKACSSGCPPTPALGVSSCLWGTNQQTNNSRYFPNWGTKARAGGVGVCEKEGWREEGTGSNPLVFFFYFKNYIFYVTITFR